MQIVRRMHRRAALLAAVGLLAVGSGAAYAATRPAAKPIGTGVVVIQTTLGYERSAAAGTGMVLTSSGRVLTNNHVIAGATRVQVRVPNTSRSYTARVVGYDVSDDVAVLQLQNATNLKTVTIGNAWTLRIGSSVTAVGNAGGTGSLTSAAGSVTALNQTITAQSDDGSAEQLIGLIQTSAALQPGDSGGPLLNKAGRVVGMNTAASAASPFTGYTQGDGYAIPIGKATTIVTQIVAGKSSARVHVGGTAFLGISVSSLDHGYGSGAAIVGVVAGGPADDAGLVAGDVITSIAGASVTGPSDVQSIVLSRKPGSKVDVTYTDTSGATQTATVTLGSGPPK